VQYLEHGVGVPRPSPRLGAERRAPGGGELVELRAAVVLREPPVALDEPALLEPVQRGVERAFLDAERVVGGLGDPAADGVAVARALRERLEHEHVERALEQVEVGRGRHRSPPRI
jgi:hypothetical protein